MDTSSRALELTIISGEALSLTGKQPVKKNAFVTFKTDYSGDFHTTNMDTDGGSYPSWRQKIFMNMPMHANFITLEVHCKTYSGNQFIGSARIPVSDFTGFYFPANYLHFLSYRLRDRRGERNGIINLSVRVKSSENNINNINMGCAASCSRPWTTGWNGAPVGQKVSSDVVTGVPVWNRY